MKLIHCRQCGDVVALRAKERSCLCGESKGAYKEDRLHAWISGPCLPLGFANWTFSRALGDQPNVGPGREFSAFVIEKYCPTVEVR